MLSLVGPSSPRRTSRIQTSESRQVGNAAEPAAGGVLEAPEWVTKLVAFDRRYSKLWLLATTGSRGSLGKHYILDVVGGMVIGMLEALVAHLCLHVPLNVSELQHDYLLSRFGLYEEAFWRFFHSRWFFTNYHREMNREMHDIVHRPA